MDSGGRGLIQNDEGKGMPTLRTAAQICDHGFAPVEHRSAMEKVAACYAVALPPALAALIDPADPHDPIARQVVPNAAELDQRR